MIVCQSMCLAPKVPNQILCLQAVLKVIYQASELNAIILTFNQFFFCLWQLASVVTLFLLLSPLLSLVCVLSLHL